MRLPRSSVTGSTFERPESTEEEKEEGERFEDVGLQDEPAGSKSAPKKKSFFSSRFGESSTDATGAAGGDATTNKSHFGLHLPGRRRGHSGQAAELGNIERPASSKGRAEGVVR